MQKQEEKNMSLALCCAAAVAENVVRRAKMHSINSFVNCNNSKNAQTFMVIIMLLCQRQTALAVSVCNTQLWTTTFRSFHVIYRIVA